MLAVVELLQTQKVCLALQNLNPTKLLDTQHFLFLWPYRFCNHSLTSCCVSVAEGKREKVSQQDRS